VNFWRCVFTIAWKDIISELRTREIISSVLVFAIMVLVIFNFAFAAAGKYWLLSPPEFYGSPLPLPGSWH